MEDLHAVGMEVSVMLYIFFILRLFSYRRFGCISKDITANSTVSRYAACEYFIMWKDILRLRCP